MLNYFNFKQFRDDILITNDFGMYAFLSHEQFGQLLNGCMDKESETYHELEEKFFVYDCDKEVFVQKVQQKARYSRNHLFAPTALFILVMTNQCNANCVYCQAKSPGAKNSGHMDFQTAKKAILLALSSPMDDVTIEFQGGEPLLNYEVIRKTIEFAEAQAAIKCKRLHFSLVSNLSLMTEDISDFLALHHVGLSTSLDGCAELHNANRPFKSGKESYDIVSSKIEMVRSYGLPNVSAIETTVRRTLDEPESLIAAYKANSFHSIFIRPLTPLGIAAERWDEIGYSPDEFVAFYEKALRRIIEINKDGYVLVENHALIFLRKILGGVSTNYMELRSPCGAGVGQMAVYYDGKVFSCDEGRMAYEMGASQFLLGSVDNSYDELVGCSVCKSLSVASVLECIPTCTDCVYQPYCGVCPVVNFMMNGTIFSKTPKEYRCRIYEGMLEVIFRILQENDCDTMGVFKRWLINEAE